ncbi:hypothetical protein, partial [Streptomyces sp. OR43]|uniref:hypothetical protein n=1 Tax=Streptomyces sp. or43 TaxID=2478957 RepID=UPI001C9BEE98
MAAETVRKPDPRRARGRGDRRDMRRQRRRRSRIRVLAAVLVPARRIGGGAARCRLGAYGEDDGERVAVPPGLVPVDGQIDRPDRAELPGE